MMRLLSALVLGLGIIAVSVSPAIVAQDKKETKKEGKKEAGKVEKLEGSLTCAKCDLGEGTACATVIKTKDKVFFFDAAAHKKHHGEVCKGGKEGTVTGTVKKDGEKMVVTVSKLEFKK